MKKWPIVALAFTILLALAGFYVRGLLLTPKPGVTVENFARVHEGMTWKEVEAILGKPKNTQDLSPGVTRLWEQDDTTIELFGFACVGDGYIKFGDHVANLQQPPKSLIEKVREFLGLDAEKQVEELGEGGNILR